MGAFKGMLRVINAIARAATTMKSLNKPGQPANWPTGQQLASASCTLPADPVAHLVCNTCPATLTVSASKSKHKTNQYTTTAATITATTRIADFRGMERGGRAATKSANAAKATLRMRNVGAHNAKLCDPRPQADRCERAFVGTWLLYVGVKVGGGEAWALA